MLYTVSEAVCPLPERHTLFTTLPKVVKKVSLGESKSWEKFHFGDLIIRFFGSPVNLELLRISQHSGLPACPEFAPFPLFLWAHRRPLALRLCLTPLYIGFNWVLLVCVALGFS